MKGNDMDMYTGGYAGKILRVNLSRLTLTL